MNTSSHMYDHSPLQDRDLLLRMSLYCDSLDSRLRQGQGWFIFNADSGRSGRVAKFLQERLAERQPPVAALVMPWRDFSLSAYVQEVGLPELEPVVRRGDATSRTKREYEFAQRLTDDIWSKLQESDLLILAGIQPKHQHELVMLDRAVDDRCRRRRATILMTPSRPQDLETDMASLSTGTDLWNRVFDRMYETSLVAF